MKVRTRMFGFLWTPVSVLCVGVFVYLSISGLFLFNRLINFLFVLAFTFIFIKVCLFLCEYSAIYRITKHFVVVNGYLLFVTFLLSGLL